MMVSDCAHLVTHAEAIAFQGILTPEQCHRLQLATAGRRGATLPGARRKPSRMGVTEEERTPAELAEILREKVNRYKHCGATLQVFVGERWVRENFPKGVVQMDPLRRKLLRRSMPRVELSKEQATLAERIDSLVIAIWRAWMIQGLDVHPLPSQSILADRLGEVGDRLRNSLFASAQLLALEGIATPEQAERALRVVWEEQGIRALRDPLLASRLRLSRSQREEIGSLFGAKDMAVEEYMDVARASLGLLRTRPDIQREVEQAARDARTRQDALDEVIWEVLNPSQARLLERILSSSEQAPAKPPTKGGVRSPKRGRN